LSNKEQVTLDKLIGRKVIDDEGKFLGWLRDLIIEGAGQISALVLELNTDHPLVQSSQSSDGMLNLPIEMVQKLTPSVRVDKKGLSLFLAKQKLIQP
jgi:sporulation protein YlmC with PRC-barrel domain